uniref:Uncharacterized protein n=1 Tax=Arundo donax TaxID=35708 RepID=A0A0A9CHQ4_ARUDO
MRWVKAVVLILSEYHLDQEINISLKSISGPTSRNLLMAHLSISCRCPRFLVNKLVVGSQYGLLLYTDTMLMRVILLLYCLEHSMYPWCSQVIP